MRSARKVFLAGLLMLAALFAPYGHAAGETPLQIQIRVLNAKNAERVANQKVTVLIQGQRDATEYVTDAEGNINVDLNPSARIWVATEWWTTCRKKGYGIGPYLSVQQVLQDGVTAQNTCGHAKSETIKGRLIIFAKKSSLIQLYKK